ncbi:hypothetical protein [uncultured Mucilaginibacter sp.]|uniref:hypothetical protein n=1 Tax=uncultured Mucilaginibacter sp. TaxID=797541 RepID=UPI00260E566C|nr:hypothetical protein [uncultured Mucilaginibacter sp.]
MLLLPNKNPDQNQEAIVLLEKEIALLEAELRELESNLNIFQTKIRSVLSAQINRIRALTDLYKSQKQAKKLKRLEQKKRGKNYKEPVGLKVNNASFTTQKLVSADDQQELKRLFKEAVVQIHPDKLTDADEELNQRATEVTAQLNEVYQNGDLDEMSRLHEFIVSGNALTYVPDQPQTIKDLAVMIQFLQDKKRKVLQLIAEIKSSELYQLWTNGRDPETIIAELKLAFEHRIAVLEKRTR